MKRDMDLVREILLKIEEENQPLRLGQLLKDPTDADETARYAYHLGMMSDQGFIKGLHAKVMSGPEDWLELELTWRGQEFLDTLRDPTIWQKSKAIATKAGGGGLQVLLDIGKALIVEAAKGMLKQ